MKPIATKDDLTPEQQATLKLVQERYSAAEPLHRQLEPRWNCWYGLSRNWHRGAQAFQQARTRNDQDVVRNELKRQFGDELFIPYGFTAIETNVPRIVSQTPRYRALPNKEGDLEAAAREPLEQLYRRDSEQMRYERKLQETVRSGLRYGLGVQKSYWEKKCRDGKKIEPKLFGRGKRVVDSEIVVFEGPQTESVDIFDFFWDPAAWDLESAQYVIHRTWRPLSYIAAKVREGRKQRDEGMASGWLDLDLEEIRKLASSTARGEAWAGRWEAAGIGNYDAKGGELFEVWEYHDREQVVTVLGGKEGIVVQETPNPFLHGDFPFEIYRPTLVEHEFCGVGEIEPIAHLQWELNTLRGQRRDAAALALQRGYFYQRGTLNPKEIRIGTGVFNPTLGNPNEILMPMPFVDPPNSGYQEESAIKGDIELTSAMSEAVTGAGGEETATGTQLVQQAANLRIRQKTKNLHVDLIAPETRKRKALYEQNVVALEQTQTIRVEESTTPTGFAFIEVTPEMLQADVEMLAVDGSTEADDPAQKKHDAAELAQTLAPFMQFIEPEKFVAYAVGQHDVEDPASWVKRGPSAAEASSQAMQQVAEAFADAMNRAGLSEEEIQQIVDSAHASMGGHEEEPQGQEQPAPEQTAPEAPAPEPSGAQA